MSSPGLAGIGLPIAICTQRRPWVSVGHSDIDRPMDDDQDEAHVTIEPKSWPNGSTVSYSFLGSDVTDEQRQTVNNAIAEYVRYANLTFKLFEDGDNSANIRIAFENENTSSICAIGTDALRMRNNDATMKLGWRVQEHEKYSLALHMIGHVLGLMHEEEDISAENPVGHSNFPNPDKTSIMRLTPLLNAKLSDADKAWLVVNYPGRDAMIDGTTWTLTGSLGVLDVPMNILSSILASSDVSKKREIYANYIHKLYDHYHAKGFVDNVHNMSLQHIPPPLEPPSYPRSTLASFKNDSTSVSAASAPAQTLEVEDPEQQFTDLVAAAVMHPQFRIALANVIKADLRRRGGNIKDEPDTAAQHWVSLIPLGLELLKGGIDLLSQSGVPLNASQGMPIGLQMGLPSLEAAEDQRMFNAFTRMLKSPLFGRLIRGALSGLTKDDKPE